MTDEERALLRATAAKTDEMHRVLLMPGATGEPPLIQRMADAAILVERGGWAAKWSVRIILTLGALGTVIATFWAQGKGFAK